MMELIFTLDCEIYGNGRGSLREMVYEPAEKLKAVFEKWDVRFVAFIEAAELEMIGKHGSDPAISAVEDQIRDFHKRGFEIGLHLHPQWFNARTENGQWWLDYSEYNLCILQPARIAEILDRAIGYLRSVLGAEDFSPLSYRAGNWLFQPTRPIAEALMERGFRIDSSVFKGGRQRRNGMDYRRALRNGPYWPFMDDVNIPDPRGALMEFPISAKMVPFWRLLTSKRLGLRRIGSSTLQAGDERRSDRRDFLRFRYPLKLDFCRMTLDEMTRRIEEELGHDRKDPAALRPVVAIGHTKDLVDIDAVDAFLSYLRGMKIPLSTFIDVQPRLR